MMESRLNGGQFHTFTTPRVITYLSVVAGKLSPRLQSDILEYDPAALTGVGYHPLTDVPHYDEDRKVFVPPCNAENRAVSISGN